MAPPERYERHSREHIRDSIIYIGAQPAAAALIIVITLSAVHRLWVFLAAATVLLAATCSAAWRALMRMPKNPHPDSASSGGRPRQPGGPVNQPPDRRAVWVAVAALAVSGVLFLIFMPH